MHPLIYVVGALLGGLFLFGGGSSQEGPQQPVGPEPPIPPEPDSDRPRRTCPFSGSQILNDYLKSLTLEPVLDSAGKPVMLHRNSRFPKTRRVPVRTPSVGAHIQGFIESNPTYLTELCDDLSYELTHLSSPITETQSQNVIQFLLDAKETDPKKVYETAQALMRFAWREPGDDWREVNSNLKPLQGVMSHDSTISEFFSSMKKGGKKTGLDPKGEFSDEIWKRASMIFSTESAI